MLKKTKDILNDDLAEYVMSNINGSVKGDDPTMVHDSGIYKKIHFLLKYYQASNSQVSLDKAISLTEMIVHLWCQNKSYHCGYQGGRGQITQVLLRLYEQTGNDFFLDHVENVFLPHIASFNKCSRSCNNFFEGRAGVLFNLLHFYQYRSGNEIVPELISDLIQTILGNIIIDLQGNYHVSNLGTKNTNGFGFGTSGIAYVLDVISQATSQEFYKDVSIRLIHTEDLYFNKTIKNWIHEPARLHDYESYVRNKERFKDGEPAPVFLDDSFLDTGKSGMSSVREKLTGDRLQGSENMEPSVEEKYEDANSTKAYKDVIDGRKISESDLCELLDFLYEDQCDLTKGNSSYRFPLIPAEEASISLNSTPSFHQLNEQFFNTHYSVSRQFLSTYCPFLLDEFFKSHNELVLGVLETYIFENGKLDSAKGDWIKEILSFESVLLRLKHLNGKDAFEETKQVFEFEKACEILEKSDEEIIEATFTIHPKVVIKNLSKPWIDVLWFNRPLEEIVQEEEAPEIAVKLNYRLFDKNLSFCPITGFNYILNEFKEKTTPTELCSMIMSEEGMEDTDAELIQRMVLEKTKQLIKGGFVLSV